MNSTELAKIAGVSRSTVSKVINNYPDVNEKTREHVLSVIKEYNYVPDFAGSVLAGKKTNVIGLFMLSDREITESSDKRERGYTTGFYMPVMQTIASVVSRCNYSVLVRNVTNENAVEIIRKFFAEKRIDSAIIVGVASDAAAAIAQTDYPVVLFSFGKRTLEEWGVSRDGIACLEYDAYNAVKNVTERLIKKGYQNIGMIYAAQSLRSFTLADKYRKKKVVSDRYCAFCDTMKENSVPINPDFMVEHGYARGEVAENLTKLIDSGALPDAFVCEDDGAAINAMECLKSHGLRIPEDVAVVGFDDCLLANYTVPSLSTIRVPFENMARTAVERAIQLADSPKQKITNDFFEIEIICRESADLN